ncbi:MAG: hypothetical protein KDC98_16560 [Planctomycetes bacterium]|nr:hypothetical protein [Planctomycetota bacterium]
MARKLGKDVMMDSQEKQQLLEQLQLAKSVSMSTVRAFSGVAVPVTIRPADSMARERTVAEGTTRELHSRSVVIEVTRPVAIGAFYEIELSGMSLGLPVVFGRCDHITMLAEDRFEARLQFLQPVTLPEPDCED